MGAPNQVMGIGTDIVAIGKIERAIGDPRFLERVYAPAERAWLEGRGVMRAASAAGLFAAKEAAVKAMGCGFAGFSPREVEISHDESGAPLCIPGPLAMKRLREMGASRALISISHDGEYAVAFAVVTG